MQSGSPLGRPENLELQQLLSQYGGPAYVRRGRRVQETFDQLRARCQAQRAEWLEMVRIRLATLYALTGDWTALDSLLPDVEQRDALRRLHMELQPQLRAAVEPTTSARQLRQALDELVESLERFNERWQRYVYQVDLAPVNEVREDYNRYYLLEKECAMRNGNLARRGFTRMTPLTHAELAALFPSLPVPRLRQ
jgi:hypothetical protein